MSIVSSDIKTNLIINRIPRSIYDQLCSTSQLQENELYLIDDDVFDMFNKRVVNVDDPVISTDAVNLNYLKDNFIDKSDINQYIDNTKIYNNEFTSYIDSNLGKYQIDYSEWDITVLKGDFSPSEVEITWNPSTTSGTLNGYNLKIKGITIGTGVYSKDSLEIHVEKHVDSLGDIIVDCIRTKVANKIDSYISMKEVFSCLSMLNSSSDIKEILNSISLLNSKLSSYSK